MAFASRLGAADATSTGEVGGPSITGEWKIPEGLGLDGDDLVWRVTLQGGPAPIPDRVLLEEFVELDGAQPECVLAFARRWGVLHICAAHGLPASHNPMPRGAALGEPDYCEPVVREHAGYRIGREPLRSWFDLAGTFNSVLAIAAALLGRQAGSMDAWERLWRPQPEGVGVGDTSWRMLGDRLGTDPGRDRVQLGEAVRRLLDWANLQASFTWSPVAERPTFEVVPGSLFTALAIELCSALAGTEALAQCSSCGRFFSPARRPRPRRRRYCRRCRAARRPQRDAERDYARRKGTTTTETPG
jgi:hypothetical protein